MTVTCVLHRRNGTVRAPIAAFRPADTSGWRQSAKFYREKTCHRWCIQHHDSGETAEDPTVACCWDADRLTLGRVGIRPQREYFSTRVVQQQFANWVWLAEEIMGGRDRVWKEIADEYERACD